MSSGLRGGAAPRRSSGGDDADVELAEVKGDGAPLLHSAATSPRSPRASTSHPPAGPAGDWRHAARTLLLGAKTNVLLVGFPFALLAHATHWGDGWVFFFSLAAICPLAERLGFVTEQLAAYTNSTMGGLLNASFGNATEVIVSVAAMRAGLLRVVQLSLLGSVLSNMLLVLGCAFLAGGLKWRQQVFNEAGVGVNVVLLTLGLLAQAAPALLVASHSELRGSASALALSRFTSVLLLCVYAAFLYFQLVTHRDLYDDTACDAAAAAPAAPAAARDADADAVTPELLATNRPAEPAAAAADAADADEEEEEDELVLTFRGALCCLSVVTLLIAILSEYLVDAIEGAAEAWGLPLAFISVILLPIVGNAAEHASAVIFARHNKLDLAIGIAVGSSTQISLLVTPGCVLLAGMLRKPLDLDLGVFETGALGCGVLMLAFAVSGGKSNWLKGGALIAAYAVLAAAFAAHDDPRLRAEHEAGHTRR